MAGSQPAVLIIDSNDSRTEMSSSTTNTIGACGMSDLQSWSDLRAQSGLSASYAQASCIASVVSECGIERVDKRRLAEGLEQQLHGAFCQQSGTRALVSVSG